jgi:hypothetical protein
MRTTGKLAAQRSATIIDDLGRRVEIVAGQTYWDPSASELRRAEVASLFGIGSESRWFAPSGAVDTSRAEPVASNRNDEMVRELPSEFEVRYRLDTEVLEEVCDGD